MANAFWGPYLSNRAWGTVRRDSSLDGNSWESCRFEDAGKILHYAGCGQFVEDGLFGFCDVSGRFIARLNLWNHKDEIIKERLFGLSGTQGNHGEDVKEVFYYLDGLPDHSYMKALYRYPQNQFPYEELLEKNLERSAKEAEFELTDTGVFDDNEYFDVLVEYAKVPDNEKNLVCCYSITNHSSQSADLTVMPLFHLPCDPEYDDFIGECQRPVKVNYNSRKFCIQFECNKDVKQSDIFLDSSEQLSDVVCKDNCPQQLYSSIGRPVYC